MAESVANVARRVNLTVEEGKDSLGKIYLNRLSSFSLVQFQIEPAGGDKGLD